MADIFIFADQIFSTGNGENMTERFQFLYVDADVTLATTSLSGRAVRTTEQLPSIVVAGHLAGLIGVEFAGSGGDLTVMAGGSVAGSGWGVDSVTSISVTNDGSISGGRGIYVDADLYLDNSGSISGGFDAVFVLGNATIINSGRLTSGGGV